MTRIEKARGQDLEQVCQLLTLHQLPLDGLREHLDNLLVARVDGGVIGSAGLEVYENGALLRSVAVMPTHQGGGVGRALIEAAIDLAWSHGVPAVYLLTTTAADYFPRFGFNVTGRESVPLDVQRSVEFTSACPSSATVMRKTP